MRDTLIYVEEIEGGDGMRALITGASSGMGYHMAFILSEMGYDVTLVARREKRLRRLAGKLKTMCQVIEADLSDARECRLVYDAARGDDLEVVINCAGFGLFGGFLKTDLETELQMIDVNIKAVHILTKLFAQDFAARDYGYILNVASSAGFMAGPLMSTYYATKNYVVRLTQALREELRQNKSKVRVSVLCPGPVNTEFNQVAGVSFALPGLDAHRVAREGIVGMFKGKGIIVPGAVMKGTVLGSKLLPDTLVARISYHFQGKKGTK